MTPTRKLFWEDPSLVTFEAAVVSASPKDGALEVVLDATAFYPEGGGQPDDRGTLGGLAVTRVEERDGLVVHLVEGSGAITAGSTVRGEIDAARRRDHRQQHSGQHLLSAVFISTCGAETVSFHLGEVSCTIDLERLVPPEEIAAAEKEANARIAEDRPIAATIFAADAPEIGTLRKAPPADVGAVRILEIDGIDRTPCGGTHCTKTSEIRLVTILGSEKAKGKSRIEFLCGDRAIARAHADRDAISAVAKDLAVAPGEVPAKLRKIREEAKATERTLRDWRSRALDAASADLARADAGAIVTTVPVGFGPEEAMELAKRLGSAGRSAVLASAAPEPTVVVSLASGDAAPVVAAITGVMGGKGGGKGGFARLAGGDPARLEAALAAARELLSGSGTSAT